MGARRLISLLTLLVVALASAAPAQAAWTAPTVLPPTTELVVNSALSGSKVPLKISWPAAKKGDGAIAAYRLQVRTDGGTWRRIDLPSPRATSAIISRRPGRLLQFRVRAIDSRRVRSKWAAGPNQWFGAVQASDYSISLDGAWKNRTPSSAFRASLSSSGAAGASARLNFAATSIGWVSTLAPDRGRADVLVDGQLEETIDLLSSTTQWRRVVFARNWTEVRRGELEIRIEGTEGRPRVDIDAVLVLGEAPTATLVGAGDIAVCGSDLDEATADVVESVPGIVFTTGDNAYPDGTAQQFAECYGPSWGRFKERTRPSPGNHDYRVKGAAAYFGYFGEAAGPAGRGWFAYDAGTWRIYSLNSNCKDIGGCGSTSAQYKWLKKELTTNPRRCVAAYWHDPRVSSGKHGGSRAMASILKLLYDHDADLVLTGHDHLYERFAPMRPDLTKDSKRGIRQFVVGSGGAPLYAVKNRAPNSEVVETGTHGVLKLTLEWNRYRWEFLPVAGKTFTDSGTATCH
jgi:hypothetical protein